MTEDEKKKAADEFALEVEKLAALMGEGRVVDEAGLRRGGHKRGQGGSRRCHLYEFRKTILDASCRAPILAVGP